MMMITKKRNLNRSLKRLPREGLDEDTTRRPVALNSTIGCSVADIIYSGSIHVGMTKKQHLEGGGYYLCEEGFPTFAKKAFFFHTKVESSETQSMLGVLLKYYNRLSAALLCSLSNRSCPKAIYIILDFCLVSS
jgi:hypothetical protein